MWRGLITRVPHGLLHEAAFRYSLVRMATSSADSLKRDAPGWTRSETDDGPVCWKCRGTGFKPKKSPKHPNHPCTVCEAKGFLPRKKLKERQSVQRAVPDGYVVPGPACPGNQIDVDDDKEGLCALLGSWRILQSKKGGHRWSSDDLLTAWVACVESKNKQSMERHLDLGCGIGTVLLMVSWFMQKEGKTVKAVGVEAQSMSAGRARRSIHYNGLDDQAQVIESDFREVALKERFDLVTGTPPYFPVDTSSGKSVPAYGGMPTHEQSAPARFEFRGGLEAYVETAARFVNRESGGLVVLCEGNLARIPRHLDRMKGACDKNAMRLDRTVLVRGRDDKPPLFAVHVLRPIESPDYGAFVQEWFDIRHTNGDRTKPYCDMCLEMGIAPFPSSVASAAPGADS